MQGCFKAPHDSQVSRGGKPAGNQVRLPRMSGGHSPPKCNRPSAGQSAEILLGDFYDS